MAHPLSSGCDVTSVPFLELTVKLLSKLVVMDLTLETVANLKGGGVLLVLDREASSGRDLLTTSILPFETGVL